MRISNTKSNLKILIGSEVHLFFFFFKQQLATEHIMISTAVFFPIPSFWFCLVIHKRKKKTKTNRRAAFNPANIMAITNKWIQLHIYFLRMKPEDILVRFLSNVNPSPTFYSHLTISIHSPHRRLTFSRKLKDRPEISLLEYFFELLLLGQGLLPLCD